MKEKKLDQKIWELITEKQLLKDGDKIIIGVSGGADSVCLLLLLKAFSQKMNLTIYAVHVEHGIRGEAALEDAAFVRELCGRLDVKCEVFHRDIPRLAKERRCSLEEAGRAVRYELFEECMERYKAQYIAVAHHQNDQAETLLMNLFRGTGLSGMRGMRVKEGHLIRPLLYVQREEIEQWLEDQGQKYCIDQTNEEDTYTRNRIRNQILSQAQMVNKEAVRHLAQACDTAYMAGEYLTRQMEKAYALCASEEDREEYRKITISRKALADQDPYMQTCLIHHALERCCGQKRDIGSLHVQSVMGLIGAKTGKEVSLPYKMTAKINYDQLILEKTGEKREDSYCCKINVPGAVTAPDGSVWEFTVALYKKEEIPTKTYTKWFDYDKIKNSLVLRTRETGDYLTVNEHGGRKKLKDYLIDQKIPRDERDSLLLLADGSHILWILGYRISEAYKVTDETRKILKVEISGGRYGKR